MKLVLLMLLTVLTADSVCSGSFHGKLTPMDPDACQGDVVTLTCSLEPRSKVINASDLVFRINNNVIDNKHTRIVDQMHKELILQNISVLKNNAFIECCLNPCSWTDSVDKQQLHVFDKPSEVTDFDCVAKDWDRILTCQWILPKLTKPYDVFSCRWQYTDMPASVWRKCPQLSETFNTTRWDSRVFNFDGKSLVIKLHMENYLCDGPVEQVLNVTVADIGIPQSNYEYEWNCVYVKPAPVIKLQTEYINSTCVHLIWEHSQPNRPKNVKISYKATNGRESKLQTLIVQSSSVFICQLSPYIFYEFDVKVHPYGNKGFWSNTVSAVVRTLPDVPSQAPEVTRSSFLSEQDECSLLGRRHVTVYWKPLSVFETNGPDTGVSIAVSATNEDAIQHGDFLNTAAQVTLTLLCNHDYHVTLQAYNSMGNSADTSTIYIPSSEADTAFTKFKKIEMEMLPSQRQTTQNTAMVHFDWEGYQDAGDGSQLSYRLYWCRKSAGLCSGEAKWLSIDGQTTTWMLELDRPNEHVYSIAVESEVLESGGLRWESCLYTRGADPGPVTDIQVTPGADDNTLHVKWQPLPCRSGSPYITGYRLYHCPRMSSEFCKEYVLLPANRLSWILKDLLGSKEYEIRLQAITGDKEGPISDPVFGIPIGKSFPVPASVAIAVSGAIVIGLVYLTIKHCRNLQKKSKKKFPVNTPSNVGQKYNNVSTNEGQGLLGKVTVGSETNIDSCQHTTILPVTTPITGYVSTTKANELNLATLHPTIPPSVTTPITGYVSTTKANELNLATLHPTIPPSVTTPITGYVSTTKANELNLATLHTTIPPSVTTPITGYVSTTKANELNLATLHPTIPPSVTTPITGYVSTTKANELNLATLHTTIPPSVTTTTTGYVSTTKANELNLATLHPTIPPSVTTPITGYVSTTKANELNLATLHPTIPPSVTTPITGYVSTTKANELNLATLHPTIPPSVTTTITGYVSTTKANELNLATLHTTIPPSVTTTITGYVSTTKANELNLATLHPTIPPSVNTTPTGYVSTTKANELNLATLQPTIPPSVTTTITGDVSTTKANELNLATLHPTIPPSVTTTITGYVSTTRANELNIATLHPTIPPSVTTTITGYVSTTKAIELNLATLHTTIPPSVCYVSSNFAQTQIPFTLNSRPCASNCVSTYQAENCSINSHNTTVPIVTYTTSFVHSNVLPDNSTSGSSPSSVTGSNPSTSVRNSPDKNSVEVQIPSVSLPWKHEDDDPDILSSGACLCEGQDNSSAAVLTGRTEECSLADYVKVEATSP